MSNLPIASNPQIQKASTTNSSNVAATNGATDGSAVDPFGKILAQQLDANASAGNNPSTVTAASQTTTTDALTSSTKGDVEKSLVGSVTTNDPSSMLAAMMLVPQANSPTIVGSSSSDTPLTVSTQDVRATNLTSASASLTTLAGRINVVFSDIQGGRETPGQLAAPTGMTTSGLGNNLTATTSRLVTPDAAVGIGKEVQSTIQTALNAAATASSALASGVQGNTLNGGKPSEQLLNISSPLAGNNWQDEFSQKISWLSTQKNQVAELHLNPPDLGPLNVVLKITDSQATVLFTSPHSAVREAIENAMPKLREVLADSGIMLGNATVNDQTPRDSGASGFTNQRDSAPSGREENFSAGTSDATLSNLPARRARLHNGMVDTFA